MRHPTLEVFAMQTPSMFIGIDVSKDELVIARNDRTEVTTVANSRKAIRDWLKTLPVDAAIGVESTGRYHIVLADLAHHLGRTVYVLDARRTKAYARALGHRGKTDRTDAHAIAHFLANAWADLRPYVPPTPDQRHIDNLLRRRGKLITVRTQFRQIARALPGFGAALRDMAEQLGTITQQMTRMMQALSRKDAKQADLVRRLSRIPGLGDLSAIALANLFCRVPLTSADQAVAFLGLDPRPCDSGPRRGRRKLTKHGPSEPRRLIYLGGMSASKIKLWKPFYQHDRQRGLTTTEAMVVLARRLLRTAWAIAYRNAEFDPAKVGVAGTRP